MPVGVDKRVLDIWNTLNGWSEELKMWIFEHYADSGLWISLFIVLLILVMVCYNYLHRR